MVSPPAKTEIVVSENLSVDGPFAFSEERWLEALHHGAGGAALSAEAGRIFKTSGGRYYIPEINDRQRITSLRRDPRIARAVAASFAEVNAKILKNRTGKAPSVGALYLAHLIGPDATARFIARAAVDPQTPASSLLSGVDLQAQRLVALTGRGKTTARGLLSQIEAAASAPATAQMIKPTLAVTSGGADRFQFAPDKFASEIADSGARHRSASQ